MTVGTDKLPEYRCHKVVQAMKIADIRWDDPHPVLFGGGGWTVPVTAAYLQKHEPKIGGYYVRYADGYESWSPAETFEEGYTPVVLGPPPRYPITEEQSVRLENVFTYHTPKGDQPARYTALRQEALLLASQIVRMSPPGREQSLALTNLEQAIFWANAAIARGE